MTDAYANKLLTDFEAAAIVLSNARTPETAGPARTQYKSAKAKVLRQMTAKK